MRSWITPASSIGLGGLLAGLGLLFLGSGTVAKVGFGIALLAVLFLVADMLPRGVMGWGGAQGLRASAKPAPPEPEYIDHADVPSEQAWAQEQERYRHKGE